MAGRGAAHTQLFGEHGCVHAYLHKEHRCQILCLLEGHLIFDVGCGFDNTHLFHVIEYERISYYISSQFSMWDAQLHLSDYGVWS